MVAWLSLVLAAYEALALLTRHPPTITHLSHTKLGVLVWIWLASLTIHLLRGEDATPLLPRAATVRERALPLLHLGRSR